jgi:hypothetical protein
MAYPDLTPIFGYFRVGGDPTATLLISLLLDQVEPSQIVYRA